MQNIKNMADWQTFKITDKKLCDWDELGECLIFFLDNHARYSDGNEKHVICKNTYPFKGFKEGDYLEIDLEKTVMKKTTHFFDDATIVRKISFARSSLSTGMTIGSTIITREHSLAVARELDAMVDQSGGTKEYTASVEVQDNQGNPIKFSISSKKAN